MLKSLPFIEQRLKELLEFPSLPEEKLYCAARYAVFSGGKRLRPLLTLAAVESLKGDSAAALTPACALELVHTYSLIHDDLPCMDDDDFRRGQPTVHKKFDEATAVLTGDFLLTYAFQVLAESPKLSAETKIELIQILSRRAGGSGMIGGQILDLSATNRKATSEELALMHQKKTGQLICAALEFGAVLSHAAKAERSALIAFGEEIGLAFQIMDDVIDVVASEKKHGKKVSSDQARNKSTYVSELGVENAKKAAEELLECALQRTAAFPMPDPLVSIGEMLVKRNF
jgi:geranylgeranyl diphosphate synthase type II